MLASSMRPKWKADVYYVPVSNGVYLRGNNTTLLLRGKSLYALLTHLVPLLTGEATLEEITEGLDEDRKKMVTNLAAKLLAHGFLQDAGQDQQPAPDMALLAAYTPDITFIASLQSSAAQRFEDFRNKRLLLIASGLSLDALVRAGVRCGVKQIGLLSTSDDDSAARSLHEMHKLCTNEQRIRLIDAPAWDNEDEMRVLIQPYDVIVHIAEQPMLSRARLLNSLCIKQQKLLNQAIVVDETAWVGPLVSSTTGACWECAWRRLQANLPSEQHPRYALQDQPSSPSCQPVTPSQAIIIGNQLLFGVFRHVTQAGSTEIAENLTAIDLATGVSEDHTFLPHPHCRSCLRPVAPTASRFLEQIQQMQRQEPIEPNVFLENFATCVDERVGIFTSVDDHFAQVPLATYKVRLANSHQQGEPASVIAVNLSANDAIVQAAQKAYMRYAATVVDQHRLLAVEMLQQHPTATIITGEQLIGGEMLPSEDELWTWAMDMQTEQAVLVPTTHVFSADERGIATGMSWEEAVCRALLDWCRFLTIAQLVDAQRSYPQVDLLKMPMNADASYLYQLLQTAGEQVTVYDVTGALQVPTFALCIGEQVIAYSIDCDEQQALRAGLERALWWHLARRSPQLDYPAAVVPALPLDVRGEQVSVPPSSAVPDTWSARREWLLQKLYSQGMHAFVVPLDHDPTLARMLPFIVRVLVSGKALQKGE